MTFNDDFCRIQFMNGTKDYFCETLGLDWPPPELINIHGFDMKRLKLSAITDEQREGMTNVIRGALYVPVEEE